jgi:hypothetical protein
MARAAAPQFESATLRRVELTPHCPPVRAIPRTAAFE